MKLITRLLVTAFIFTVTTGAAQAEPASSFITIGTGYVTGVYYPTGGAICRLVNKGRKQHGVRCSVESTDGSVYNLNAIRSRDLDMAVVQSDWLYHAYRGSSKFKQSGAFSDLRSIFSVHTELFTIVARADSGIRNLMDLKGKRVSIGDPGSGQRGTMEVLMDTLGWSRSTFAKTAELKASEQSAALCDNQIDAMVYIVGHPNGSIKEATLSCDTVLVNVTGAAVDKLVRENQFYLKAAIPGGMYSGIPNETKTFGVGAIVVASSAMNSETVYQVVKSVFENFDDFKSLHPAFNHLQKSIMIRDGLTAPLHEGAVRYYKEVGLM